jgi:hypothetical protein
MELMPLMMGKVVMRGLNWGLWWVRVNAWLGITRRDAAAMRMAGGSEK